MSGPTPDMASGTLRVTDERQRKMVFSKQETWGGPTCWRAAR
ncbi:hypothetical protein SMD44_01440 [Streptomyces alboflavus]|uniref:Uncharacterized protein n=1 Tax=Streptomyces alboflavus TaxID=67267 RepID=A0A1Z1W6N4_9ACTN|nr:hypothetical protein SMD44_01440 [Streptomyces alboflavus]